MSAHFSTDATRRTLIKAMAGAAGAAPLLGSGRTLASAAPAGSTVPTMPLLQTDATPMATPTGAISPEVMAAISTPATLESSLGTLAFVDGIPSPETVAKSYDYLDLMRGVDVFLNAYQGASTYSIVQGLVGSGVPFNAPYVHAWTFAHFGRLTAEFEASVQREPLIPAGAPVDYVPIAP